MNQLTNAKRWFAVVLAALLLLMWVAPALAQTGAEGGVVVSTAYPSILADKGKLISYVVEVTNSSKAWQTLDLKVEGPADWNPILRLSGYTVRRIMVGPEKTTALDFQITPPATAESKEYTFVISATNPATQVNSELRISVSLQDKIAKTGLKLETQYPESRGQAGTTFSYSATLTNEAEQDRLITFSATAPAGWEVTFRPGYESRQVTTMTVKGENSQTVNIDVVTPQRTDAGEYSVIVRATADKQTAELPLKIIVLGNYKLSLSTSTGQLSTRATVDKETKLSLVLRNTGTAPLKNINLNASKPDGWEVTFSPEKLDEIPVGGSVTVDANLKPGRQALAGDYMVTMSAYAGQASDSKDIRVTVETPTTWGIAAVAVIVIVLGGLGLVFARFSRR